MKKALTTKTIENIKPTLKRIEIRDTILRGFSLRASPNGLKTFYTNYRHNGKQRRVKLGNYPALSLKQARVKASHILVDVETYERNIVKPERHRNTVSEVGHNFIELYAKPNNKDWKGSQNRLYRNFIDLFGDILIEDITKAHIHSALDKIMARGAHGQANRVLCVIRKFFNWSIERGYIEHNPAAGISPPSKEIARDRVLEDDELKRVWGAFDEFPFPFEAMFKILTLTGQRRGEVSGMKWSEICFETKTWSLPATRVKNGRAHSVPLCPIAIDILKSLPRFLNSDLVFTTTGTTPVSGFGKYKKRIDEISGVKDWRLHDLRRTAASGMAKLGVAPHVVERILNHSTGTISGVAAVYNRYGYETEKREALEVWNNHILKFRIRSEKYYGI